MRRFLQGLGLGILSATLVFTIAYMAVGRRKMTDDQIIARAKQLGMVEKEESIFSASAQDNIGEVVTPDAILQEPAGEGMENSLDENQSIESQEAVNPLDKEQGAAGQEPAGDGTENALDEEQETAGQENENPEEPVLGSQGMENPDAVLFLIESGEDSIIISSHLQEQGLIDDADGFAAYLEESGFSRLLRAGTFELYPSMSYEEIAKIMMMQ